MTDPRADYLTRFKPSGEEALAEKPISASASQGIGSVRADETQSG